MQLLTQLLTAPTSLEAFRAWLIALMSLLEGAIQLLAGQIV